jgi:perosamine synthetase
MKIQLADWKCSDKERKYVNQVLDSGKLTYGPWQKKLEGMWSKYHNCKHGVINSSGTSALQLAFRAVKEKYGWDNKAEVIVPAITFPATLNMVLESGLKLRLCDVSIYDGMIDVDSVMSKINKNTKAICIVHLWGTPYPRKQELLALCHKHNIKIIEDSCETISHDVGNWGEVSCFSMYFNHIISAGCGGMACTNDKELASIMRSLANHGMIDTNITTKYKRFNFNRIGYSSRVTEMEAALGVAQFEKIDSILAYRRKICGYITQGIEDLSMVGVIPIGGTMMYPLLLNDFPLDVMLRELDNRGIECRTALPITNQLAFKDIKGKFPIAEIFNKSGMFIPIHPYMKREHCKYIVESMREALECC